MSRAAVLTLLCFIYLATPAWAHESADAGWLHPLTGADHAVAMIAVGAWSAQMGRRAVWMVPAAFVIFMAVGGGLGLMLFDLSGVELGIAASVLLLGLAIGFERRLPLLFAATAVAVFGLFHGYAHGYEIPIVADKAGYIAGFLFSTALLHVLGLVGARLLLGKCRHGEVALRALGLASACFGVWLIGGQVGLAPLA